VAPLRRSPDPQSEQVTQLLHDEPLTLNSRRGVWLRVTTAYGYQGWVEAESLRAGCGSLPPPLELTPLFAARLFLGAPYVWGGLTSAGIDCSGLVHMAYRLTGQLIPRDAWQQENFGEPIDASESGTGDLVTYGTESRPDHIAFLSPGGRILHATARDGLGVVDEPEPPALVATRRSIRRIPAATRD
jgi:hypothetical protein